MRRKAKAMMKSRFEFEKENQKGSNSIRKGSRMRQRGLGNTNVASKKNKRSWARLDMKFEILQGKVVVILPIRTKSEANLFEPWRVRHGRHKEQKRIVALGLKPVRQEIKLPCSIMLTRFAPDFLDAFDNLPMSFKYIVDAVCAIITGDYRAGRADSDKRIVIACDQVKSDAYGIKIEITY